MGRSFLTGLGALVITCMLVLAGCGGGGGSKAGKSGTNDAASLLSGTAAAGAPIVGMVTVKDADGVMKSVTIGSDGKYSIDVTGLKAPFKLKAEGKVGSTSIVCYSAALSTDVGSTINITPFTDLIIAQVAGEVADAYFASADTSRLTGTNIQAETARIRTALANVLQAAGVSTSIDLLRASFNADSTGLDQVMDIVKVTVDPSTGAAQLRNVLNNSSVSYNVSAPGTIGVIAAPQAGAISDADEIRIITKRFFDLLASSIPSYQQIQGLGVIDEANFKQWGFDLNGFYGQVLNDSSVIGISFTGIRMVSLTATDAEAEVSFLIFGESHSFPWKYRKENGVWKVLGDQRIAQVSIDAAANKEYYNGSWRYSSGLNIDITDPNNVSAYALVKGPGLPQGGVRLENRMTSDRFVVVINGVESSDWVALADATIASSFASSAANIPYTFELYAADDSLIASYTDYLSKPPYTTAEVQNNAANYFATLTTPGSQSALRTLLSQLNDGSAHSTTIAWSIPAGMHNGEVTVNIMGGGTSAYYDREGLFPTSTTLFSLQAKDGTGQRFTVQNGECRIHIRDPFGREFDTAIFASVQ